jgi:hypothetical protein
MGRDVTDRHEHLEQPQLRALGRRGHEAGSVLRGIVVQR